ncbi:MAG: transglutaminase-like cysteine peptidase [Roseobacter sp.]
MLKRFPGIRLLNKSGRINEIILPSDVLKKGLQNMQKPMSILLAGIIATVGFVPASQASQSGAFLVPQKAIHAPSGAVGLCNKYSWACKASASASFSGSEKLTLARKVNSSVNRQVRQIEDRDQYGREEHWALPTRRGGDCEDLVLLKKKMLLEQGVPSSALLISTVLDKKMRSHAVLVLRTSKGDMILDSLTDKILPWKKTGYTFLKLQNPKSLSRWDAVLAGGVIKDRPTASR